MLPKQLLLSASAIACGALVTLGADDFRPVSFGTAKAHPTRLLVRTLGDNKSPQIQRQSAAVLAAVGMRPAKSYKLVPGLMAVDLDESNLGKSAAMSDESRAQELLARIVMLRESGLFRYVEPDYVQQLSVTSTDPKFVDGTLWGLQNTGQDGGRPGVDVGALAAWQISTGSTNVIVAVHDSGIRYTHFDLRDQMWVNEGESGLDGAGRDKRTNGVDDDSNGVIDDVHGFNAVLGSGDPFDDNGHGTHVAGTIGAAANNGYSHVGVNWNVRLMAVKVGRSDGFLLTGDIIDGINYSVQMGAKISNNSYGGTVLSEAEQDVVRQAGVQGQLFIAAAGNDGVSNDVIPHYPANFPLDNVISVAAIDRKGFLATFSNYGKKTVHIAAPGVSIYSTWNDSDLSYNTIDGTSMATPHVVGVAALIKAAHPNADMNEIRERILGSAVRLDATEGTTTTGGMVSALKAIEASADGVLEFSANPPAGSSLLIGTSTVLQIKIADVIPVPGAVVSGSVEGGGLNTSLVFSDDGIAPDITAGDSIYTTLIPATAVEGPVVVKFTASATNKDTLEAEINYTSGGRPVNDNFAKARKIATGGQILTDTTRFSTLEAFEPVHLSLPSIAGSLWYAWAPSTSGKVLIETVGSGIDTYLAVYTGDSLRTLKQIGAVNDNGTKKNGSLVLDVTAGTTYRIAVGGKDAAQSGPIRLRVVPNAGPDTLAPVVSVTSPPSGLVVTTDLIDVEGIARDQNPNPSGLSQVFVKVNESAPEPVQGTESWVRKSARLRPGLNVIEVSASDVSENISDPVRITVNYIADLVENDHFSNGTVLSGSEGNVQANNANASREFGEPLHGGNQGGRSLWYTFVAPEDGVLTLDTTGSTYDTVIATYSGNRLSSLTNLGSNDDATPSSGYSRLQQAVEAGSTVRIAVDGFAGQSGLMELAYAFEAKKLLHFSVTTGQGGLVDVSSGLYPEGATVVVSATPDSRHEFQSWTGTLTSFDPVFEFKITKDIVLTANFRERQYTDGFETGSFASIGYSNSGDAAWKVTSGTAGFGMYSAQAGKVGDSQFSGLKLQVNVRAGIGTFDYKVSSEEGWDWLEFYIDGSLHSRWSGEVDWSAYGFSVPAGVHTFEWRYSKDVARSAGMDTAFIDNLLLPRVPGLDDSSPASLRVAEVKGGVARLRIEGQIGQTYVTQWSTDLVHWRNLSSDVNETGVFFVTDTQSSEDLPRFYRSIIR